MDNTRDRSDKPPAPISDETLRALRESEERYRALFDNMTEGFALFGVVRSSGGQVVDLIYREANKALERQTGLNRAKIIGQPLTAILPPSDAARFIPVLASAVHPGGLTTIEEYAEFVDRWFEVSAYPHGQDEVVAIYRDISGRKRAEAVLRESDERQTFLLKLSDALRAEPSAEAVGNRAVRMLFEQMGLDRCFIGTFFLKEDRAEYHHQVHDDCLPPLPDEVRISDFPEAFQVLLDGSLIIDNVAEAEGFSDDERANIEALGMHALIDVTLRKGEKNPLWAIIAGSMHPRVWTPGEVALVEQVAERTWVAVERARVESALRNSESRLRAVFDSVDQGFMEVEVEMSPEGRAVDWRYVTLNPAFYRLTGMEDVTGRLASEVFPDREPEWAERYAQVVTTGEPIRFELPAAAIGRWFDINLVNIGGAGSRRIAVVYDDITKRKQAEAVLHENEALQAFLLKLSDALRDEPTAGAIANRALRMLFTQMGLDRCYIGIFHLMEDRAEFTHQVHDDCLPAVPGEIRLSDFPKAFEIASERTLVVDNIAEEKGFSDSDRANIEALGMRSFVTATLRKGENHPLWSIVAGSMQPRVWTAGEVSLVEDVAERTWAAVERARSEAEIRDAEKRFQEFSDASTNVLWIRDVKTLRMEFASPAFDKIYGIPGPDCGGDGRLRSWARLIEPESRKIVLANFRRVREGERVEQEFRVRRASDGTLRWIHDTGFPLRDANGDVRFIAGLGADITDIKETTDRQGVLVEELQHRTRNLIAVVRAISDRTLSNAKSLEDFGARFRSRLSALSRVQGLLSHLAAGDKVTFMELLCCELEVYVAADSMSHKVTLDGPDDVRLPSRTVQTFALAIHELATNAIKYGALAATDGHLFVGWRVEHPVGNEPPHLHVEWRESGVTMPDVGAPAKGGGYGRELIERALPYQLKAKTTYELGVDGVRCTIVVPLSRTASNGILGSE